MTNAPYAKHVKLSDAQREQLLDHLDASGAGLADRDKAAGKSNRRLDQRLPYRQPDIAMAIEHPGGTVSRLLVCARNLSAGGMSFLHGGFLHPGSRCRIALRQTDGRGLPVDGRIVSCRHIKAPLHEVGVQFQQRIDLHRFIQPSRCEGETAASVPLKRLRGSILYIDASPADQDLMRFFLESSGATLRCVNDGTQGLELVRQNRFDVILTELTLPGLTGPALIKAVREAGFTGPIIAVTADERPQLLQQAKSSGCNEVMIKPLDFAALTDLLGRILCGDASISDDAPAGQPLYSSRWGDVNMRPLILEFLNRVEADAMKLKSCMETGGAEAAAAVCLSLKGSAGAYGYPQISKAAKLLLELVEAGLADQQAAALLQELLQLCTAACSIIRSPDKVRGS